MNVPELSRPKVGVAVYLIDNENNLLLGLRINAHGEGCWCPPGGHLEFFESIENCAIREVSEETGLTAENVRILGVTNDCFAQEQKHYVTIHTQATVIKGQLQNLELDKFERWEWFSKWSLPKNLFLPVKNFIENGKDLFLK